MDDLSKRIFIARSETLVSKPFKNIKSIQIKRALFTPTRVILSSHEHCALNNIFISAVKSGDMGIHFFFWISLVQHDFS